MMDEEREPDGYVLCHGEGMVWGPLPDADFLIAVMDAMTCDCIKSVRPVYFPMGVSMHFHPPEQTLQAAAWADATNSRLVH